MAMTKKSIRNIALTVVGLIILFCFFYYFNMVKITSEEAPRVDIRIPVDMRSHRSSFDKVERTKLRWKDAVSIIGWVAQEDVTTANRDLYVVLRSKTDTVIFKAEEANLNRPDVTKALKIAGNVNGHGYKLTFPVKHLTGSAYKVSYIIEDETGKYICNANKILTIPNDKDSGVIITKLPDPGFVSREVPFQAVKANHDIKFSFDKISVSNDYVSVRGWAFLNALDVASMRTFLLLKQDNRIRSFEIKVHLRPDVTKALGGGKIDLDGCGFIANIPTEILTQGKYKVGLMLIKGDQTGIIFPDKYITIGQ